MTRPIPDRLTKVAVRIAAKFRTLGFITARLYFKSGGDYQEIDILSHQDLGITAKNWRTGIEISGHRHKFEVSAQWWLGQSGQYGTYAIAVDKGSPILECEFEGATMQDDATSATIDLRVIQSVTSYE